MEPTLKLGPSDVGGGGPIQWLLPAYFFKRVGVICFGGLNRNPEFSDASKKTVGEESICPTDCTPKIACSKVRGGGGWDLWPFINLFVCSRFMQIKQLLQQSQVACPRMLRLLLLLRVRSMPPPGGMPVHCSPQQPASSWSLSPCYISTVRDSGQEASTFSPLLNPPQMVMRSPRGKEETIFMASTSSTPCPPDTKSVKNPKFDWFQKHVKSSVRR